MEAKRTRAKPTPGEPLVMTDNPAKQKDGENRDETPQAETKLGRNQKESKENNCWQTRNKYIRTKKGNRKPGTAAGESNHRERKGSGV